MSAEHLQPVTPQPGGAEQEAAPTARSSPSSNFTGATLVFVVCAAALVAVVSLALKTGKGAVYQRHAALIGGVVGFVAGFGGCRSTDPRPGAFTLTLLAGAVCSLPGFIVGYVIGKKEP